MPNVFTLIKANQRLTTEILFVVIVNLMCLILLFKSLKLPIMSAIFPTSMLAGIIIFTIAIGLIQLKKNNNTDELSISNFSKVIGAFIIIIVYSICVSFIGFYVSTIVLIPITSFLFGYKNIKGILLATIIFVGLIYTIFSYAMNIYLP